jgi:hypothetical protein
MAPLQGLELVLNDLLLFILMLVLVGMWAHAVATYDWTKFEEDSKDDDFLKTLDNNK